jgi:hypothetical protein
MASLQTFYRWFLVSLSCVVVCSLAQGVMAAERPLATRTPVKLMVLIKGAGQESSQTVETTLIRLLQGQGYQVLDASTVAQVLRRNAELLQQYEVEAAKRLGTRLGADIVISGEAKPRVVDKTYDTLGGKKVTVSQATVSAKAILARSGKVLAAESAHGRKPFDTTGEIALQVAAEALAGKLVQGIEQFLTRDTVDYQLFVLNVSHPQSLSIQDALRNRVQGIRQVHEQGFVQNTLELGVSVDRHHDIAFKSGLAARLSGLGLGGFEVMAREGETIYLRRVGRAKAESTSPPDSRSRLSASQSQSTQQETTNNKRSEETIGTTGVSPTPGPTYKAGYGKSWAVVIGINAYQKWPKLGYAVNDAQSVGTALKRFGFDEVITIFDGEATQQRILRTLGDDLYVKTQEEDRVFIFFAGHGQTQDLPNGNKVGYIIPVEGEINNYYSTAISMRQLQDLSERLRAKHIFFALDACFSGLLLRMRGDGTAADAVLEGTTAPVRQVLTAGSEGEQVVEFDGNGLFTKVLLSGLQGEADVNRDSRITASELYQFINPRVLESSKNSQNPVFGRIGLGKGEFVF